MLFLSFGSMKLISLCLVISLLAACAKKAEQIPIYDFIKSGTPVSGYREYTVTSDTSITRVWLQQTNTKLNDTTWQFTTYWLNADSLPINAGIERYFASNNVQLIKQSYFEQIGKNRVIEVNGKMDTMKHENIFSKKGNFLIDFISRTDSAITMQIEATIHARLIENEPDIADDDKTLEIISNEISHINFLDERQDTSINTTTRRVYTLNKGLIYFTVGTGNNEMTFKLVQ